MAPLDPSPSLLKRRKSNHREVEADALGAVSPLKLTPSKEREEIPQALARCAERNLLVEIFSRLGSREILNLVAPVCRAWRDEANSQDLWLVLRRHLRLIDQLLVVEKEAD